MNKRVRMILISLLACFAWTEIMAQQNVQPNLKFGNPSKEELSITSCPFDSTAKAMVLCSITDVNYVFSANNFKVEYTVKRRIKILSQEGVEEANISIPTYNPDQSGGVGREQLYGIKATAYNMVNGKLVKTKMGNNLIFEERLDKKHLLTKFTVPQVKAGTVIEYQYVKSSDFYYQIDDWYAQESIPVLYTQYDIEVPSFFVFNLDQTGANSLQYAQTNGNKGYFSPDNPEQTTIYSFKGHDLPALKNDKYLWCPEMYANKVGFELRSINIPGAYYKDFTATWKDIDDQLMKDDDFGARIKRSNPLKNEMKAARLDTISDFTKKLAATIMLLKKQVKWDGTYALFGNSSRNVLKEGKASNADINFLLMNMLNAMNIKTVPLVMRIRDEGILPVSHPSLEALNTFVVGVFENDSTMHFVDGSAERGYVDILPPTLLTKAHAVNGGVVDLMSKAFSKVTCMITAEMKDDGSMKGKIHTRYQGLSSLMKKRDFLEAKDSADYVKDVAKQFGVNANQYKLQYVHKYSPVTEQWIGFEKDGEAGNLIYLNPVLDLPFGEIPFTAPERKLPVEFDSPFSESYVARIKLPANYVLEELPKPVYLRSPDSKLSFVMQSKMEGDVLLVNYNFAVRKPFFLPTEYAGLKSFFEDVYNKVKSVVVLKKQ